MRQNSDPARAHGSNWRVVVGDGKSFRRTGAEEEQEQKGSAFCRTFGTRKLGERRVKD
jgi:predicted N-acetyltransferase YhbS